MPQKNMGKVFTKSGANFDLDNLTEVKTRKEVRGSDILKKGINEYLATRNIAHGFDDNTDLGKLSVVVPKGVKVSAAGHIPNFANLRFQKSLEEGGIKTHWNSEKYSWRH